MSCECAVELSRVVDCAFLSKGTIQWAKLLHASTDTCVRLFRNDGAPVFDYLDLENLRVARVFSQVNGGGWCGGGVVTCVSCRVDCQFRRVSKIIASVFDLARRGVIVVAILTIVRAEQSSSTHAGDRDTLINIPFCPIVQHLFMV